MDSARIKAAVTSAVIGPGSMSASSVFQGRAEPDAARHADSGQRLQRRASLTSATDVPEDREET